MRGVLNLHTGIVLALTLFLRPDASAQPPDDPAIALQPISTIPLSGAAASSVALANNRLWVTHHESSVLSLVDPLLDREAAAVEVGPWAASVTAVGGSLWLGHYTTRPEDSSLTSVDPATGAILLQVPVPHLCCEPAGANGKVWVIDPRGALLTLDASTGAIVSTTPVPLAPNVHMGLLADEWAVWLSSDTTPVVKVDPASAAVIAAIDVGGGIPMTFAEDLVWGAGPHHLWAIDPFTDAVRVSFPLESTIEVFSLAVTGGALWAAVRRPGYVGRVLRLDRATGLLTGEAQVALPARILHAFGDIFVVDWETNSLFRFRP